METTFKRRADDAPFTITDSQEIFPYISDDPDFINECVAKEPPLCMVVNDGLNDLQINNLVNAYYVYLVEYNGEERLGVACGFYKEEQAFFDKLDPKLMAKCNGMKKWVNGGKRETPVLLKKIPNPLCILISDELEEVRRDMLSTTYETIQVEHDENMWDAIACVYMNPNYDPGPGKVISQHMVINP